MKKLRLFTKGILKKYFLIPCYCKDCGRDITDFHVSKREWVTVMGKDSGIEVCYDCFVRRYRVRHRRRLLKYINANIDEFIKITVY